MLYSVFIQVVHNWVAVISFEVVANDFGVLIFARKQPFTKVISFSGRIERVFIFSTIVADTFIIDIRGITIITNYFNNTHIWRMFSCSTPGLLTIVAAFAAFQNLILCALKIKENVYLGILFTRIVIFWIKIIFISGLIFILHRVCVSDVDRFHKTLILIRFLSTKYLHMLQYFSPQTWSLLCSRKLTVFEHCLHL